MSFKKDEMLIMPAVDIKNGHKKWKMCTARSRRTWK